MWGNHTDELFPNSAEFRVFGDVLVGLKFTICFSSSSSYLFLQFGYQTSENSKR